MVPLNLIRIDFCFSFSGARFTVLSMLVIYSEQELLELKHVLFVSKDAQVLETSDASHDWPRWAAQRKKLDPKALGRPQ
jgi:hypothetical protein